MGSYKDIRAVQQPVQLLPLKLRIGVQFFIFQHVEGGPGDLAIFQGLDQRRRIMDLPA